MRGGGVLGGKMERELKGISTGEGVRRGGLSLEGPPQLTGAFMTWGRPSPYADVTPAPRPRRPREGYSAGSQPRSQTAPPVSPGRDEPDGPTLTSDTHPGRAMLRRRGTTWSMSHATDAPPAMR